MTPSLHKTVEVKWLRQRIAEICWNPSAAREAALAGASPVKAPTRQTIDQAFQEQKDRELQAASMTVAEYNNMRGQTATRRGGQPLPYIHQEYPKMLYRAGMSVTVADAIEHKARMDAGWKETP